MSEPIFDPAYWKRRLADAVAREQVHYAVFEGSVEKWHAARERHRRILREHIQLEHSVLDAGCGWGRLLDLLPGQWRGGYVGVDLCPEFIQLAETRYPRRMFLVGDLRSLNRLYVRGERFLVNFASKEPVFDWAILCSIKPMVVRNAGEEVWGEIEDNLRRVARRLLILAYDDLDDFEGVLP